MTKILHIESATQICSVCISHDTDILGMRETQDPNSHSKLLTVFIEQLLDELKLNIHDLDAIALSLGPGSYTGLRIGTSTAKGLAYGSGIPVIGLDSLQIMANRILHNTDLIPKRVSEGNFILRPMIDARRMEVYTAPYNQDLHQLDKVRAVIIDESSFSKELEEQPVIFFGNGAEKCAEVIHHSNAIYIPDIESSSLFMPSLAMKKFKANNFLNTAYFEPFYLKEFIATIPKNKVIPDQVKKQAPKA
jgi:tRNA threonylcarbamoyladenosine biosynthesis protein TsaB